VPLLARLEEAGRAAWPALRLAPERFAAYLGARVGDGGGDLAAALQQVHAEDLYLACACVDGAPGAAEAFRALCRPAIEKFARGVDAAPTFVDEVEQALHAKLLVGAEGQPPRLAGYAGRGPLIGWVGIAAQRTALSLRRGETAQARARKHAMEEQRALAQDAELAYLKRRYRTEFESAFSNAVAALTDRERAVMRLHLAANVTLDAIAAMYQVNSSTISRWLQAARERLTADTEKQLRKRLRLTATELESLARVLASDLDFSVCRLLDGEDKTRASR
jgi:RNA polymerase sigma-70 factor (ECF subfamily)